MNTNKKEVIVHGECFCFPSTLPEGAKKVNVDGPYKIIADSETTGNHHVVDCPVGVSFYEDNENLFMTNEVETNLRCVMEDRHDSVVLEPGTYQFGIQKEYDHINEELTNVRD
jgi:hypothetical protein